MKRRMILGGVLSAVIATSVGIAGAETPSLAQKDRYKVGFAQMESNNPWRIAETKSFHEVAEVCNWDLVATDAAGSAAKQVADVDSMIAQGVDAIFLPPREEKPLIPAVMKAKAAGIPVFLVDRTVDSSVAKAGRDYVAFIGHDLVEQGRLAADWLIENFEGEEGLILELEGTTGSSPANDRKKGFHERIGDDERFSVVAAQTGDFARDLGRQVTETLLQAHPDANIIFAHNDEMALGAIQALKSAGRSPGDDVVVVSIDGTREALQAIIDGEMGVTVESTPFLAELSCELMQKYAAGEDIPSTVTVENRVFTEENASEHVDSAF